MNYTFKKKFDSMTIGAVTGLISPLISLFTFYLVKYSHITFSQFFNTILLGYNILAPVISLCVIINLLVFFIFLWTNRNYSARGVLLATFVYAGYVMYQKYMQ
ncbi:MAG: hypothetical protein HY840_04470 [Bacteroidetes bacterium]|nr:hypothetical protein [Bacteroidota bacterium]